MASTMNPQPAPRPKQFSTPALLFGSIIAGFGLAGIVASIGNVGWDAGLAIGMILGGSTTIVGLIYRWRLTNAPATPPPVPDQVVDEPSSVDR